MKVKINYTTGRSEIHFCGVIGDSYTLCGVDDIDGTDDAQVDSTEVTELKVNCKDCLAVFNYCKKLKN